MDLGRQCKWASLEGPGCPDNSDFSYHSKGLTPCIEMWTAGHPHLPPARTSQRLLRRPVPSPALLYNGNLGTTGRVSMWFFLPWNFHAFGKLNAWSLCAVLSHSRGHGTEKASGKPERACRQPFQHGDPSVCVAVESSSLCKGPEAG